jgi:DNA-binding transcriptional ArsR family regulator
MEGSQGSDDVFSAIAAPVRRDMLRHMAAGEVPVTDLAEAFGMSLSAVSQHLAVLREAGLVTQRKEGRQRFYRTNPEPLRAVATWLDTYAPFWNDRLGALTRHLEETRGNQDQP